MVKIGVIGHQKVKIKGLVELRFWNVMQNDFPDELLQFNFGSHSEFDDLIWQTVAKVVDEEDDESITLVNYACGKERPLLANERKEGQKWFDEVVYPENAKNVGKRLYIERNKALIDASDVMIFYYDENTTLPHSGTRIAYEYAKSKNKKIINLFK